MTTSKNLRTRTTKYGWEKMEIGDSKMVAIREQGTAAHEFAKRRNANKAHRDPLMRFTVRKEGKQYRVKRIS